MAMAMAVVMAMKKQKLSTSNWEAGMLKWCCLSAHSDRTHQPPAAKSDNGTHHCHVPEWRRRRRPKKWIMTRPQPTYLPPREIAMKKQQQEGSNSNWKGELKRWSLALSYGFVPLWIDYDDANDIARLYHYAQYFKVPEDEYDFKKATIDFAYYLDAFQEYVGYMEIAQELHSIDCLVPLLHNVLYYSHANIRAKAAELVDTMVNNNPKGQQLVMEVNGLQPLWYNFTSDPDATSRTNALGAISALIRNNKPGITAFQLNDGYAKLRDALSTETQSVIFQREALNLIHYLIHENSSDGNIVTELGLPRIMIHLASSDDFCEKQWGKEWMDEVEREVRKAALRCLGVLARDEEGGNNGQLIKNDDKLKQVLEERIERISGMYAHDRFQAREEIQLVDSLWNICYNEPSSLGEKGLLVLPGKDAPAPDVASKLFEPPPRAYALMLPASYLNHHQELGLLRKII